MYFRLSIECEESLVDLFW